jgi:hypothetical protein
MEIMEIGKDENWTCYCKGAKGIKERKEDPGFCFVF